ncbi:MAG: prepilin peptidase [Candidatus Levybacteria bacterium]|nr:prepilin peptidase [Candidatus Levybacteria bacterium]
MIPVLSYLTLGGKCRHCKGKISPYYPLVELITGVLFVLVFSFFKPAFDIYHLSFIIYYFFIVSSLIVVFFIDLKYGVIPDKIVFPTIILSVFYLAVGSSGILSYLFSALGAFLFFLVLLTVTSGKGMGWGDVKYSFLMGLILGFPNIVIGLYLAFLTGAIVSIILILWKKKKLRGSTIPFGPFLVTGTILSLFYSEFFLNLLGLKIF